MATAAGTERVKLPLLCLVAAFGALMLGPDVPQREESARPQQTAAGAASVKVGLTDALDIADASGERAHGFMSGGGVARGIVGDQVGGHNLRRTARTVRGVGSWVSYRLKVHPTKTTTLEFEEMYGRDTDVCGYLVLVDGKKTHLRTWQGAGAGPVHFFVRVPTTGKDRVTVKLLNVGSVPFAISRVWAFADFDRYFDVERLAVPFYLAPTLHLTFSDYAADRAALNRIKTSLGDHPYVRPAFTAFLPYASLGARETEARIDYALRLAQEMGMPVQLGFDTWWASTPGGSDGKGGLWTDVQYQQVVYNATRSAYQLSIPNRWSSTPWLTVNHPHLNAFKVRRLTESMHYLRRRHQELLAKGKEGAVLSVNLDNEPVYWASGNAGLGSDLLLADFNPQAIAAARQEGITLDPTNGLSREERRWLSGNLLRYNERIGSAAVRGLGRDTAVVAGSSVAFPGDHLAANIYTQAMVGDAAIQYPMLNAAYPFWETAAPASVRVGGEWNADTVEEQQAVTRQIALGRNAAVNAESSNNAEKMRGVRVGFALAQRYYTLYNYPLDRMDRAASEIRDTAQPFPQFVFQPVLLESDFRDEDWRKRAAGYGGLTTGIIGNTAAVAAFPVSSERPGYLEYVVRPASPGRVFEGGPFLEVTGRAFVSGRKDPSVQVRVLAGSSPDASLMREVARFFDTGHFGSAERIDLSEAARGKEAVYVRIEMYAPGLPREVLSWCSVRQVRFTAPWPASVTQGLPRQDNTLATARRQNLVVSWRRDAELAIRDLTREIQQSTPFPPGSSAPPARLAAARASYARSAYAEAYRRASEGRSVLLPAAYVVRRSGKLAPYPVLVEAALPVQVTVQECRRERVRLDLRALGSATDAILQVGGLMPHTPYTVRWAGGQLTISRVVPPAKRDMVASGEGELRLRTRAELYPPPATPSLIRGVFRSTVATPPGGFFLLPEDGSGRARVFTDAQTVLRRGQPGGPMSVAAVSDLRPGDQIEARIGPDGIAAEVTALYQTIEGIVSELGPLTPFAMPYLTLREDGSDVRHIIDLSAPMHLPQGNANFRTSPLGAIKLAPGDRITLHTNPATGRVYELWHKTE